MTSVSEFRFVRKPSSMGAGRVIVTIPPDIAQLLDMHQKYEITLRPIGSLAVRIAPVLSPAGAMGTWMHS